MKKTISKPKSIHIRHNLSQEEKRSRALKICGRVAAGEFLVSIAAQEGIHPNTFRNWAGADPAIACAYEVAHQDRGDRILMDIRAIVYEELPTCKDSRGNVRIDPGAVARMKARMDVLRWMHNVLVRRRSDDRSTKIELPELPPESLDPAPQEPSLPAAEGSSPNPDPASCAQNPIGNQQPQIDNATTPIRPTRLRYAQPNTR